MLLLVPEELDLQSSRFIIRLRLFHAKFFEVSIASMVMSVELVSEAQLA
jgi:hypothetical protein